MRNNSATNGRRGIFLHFFMEIYCICDLHSTTRAILYGRVGRGTCDDGDLIAHWRVRRLTPWCTLCTCSGVEDPWIFINIFF